MTEEANNSKNVFHIASYTTIFLSLLYLIYTMYVYFQYETVSTIGVEKLQSVENPRMLPGVSICYGAALVANSQNFKNFEDHVSVMMIRMPDGTQYMGPDIKSKFPGVIYYFHGSNEDNQIQFFKERNCVAVMPSRDIKTTAATDTTQVTFRFSDSLLAALGDKTISVRFLHWEELDYFFAVNKTLKNSLEKGIDYLHFAEEQYPLYITCSDLGNIVMLAEKVTEYRDYGFPKPRIEHDVFRRHVMAASQMKMPPNVISIGLMVQTNSKFVVTESLKLSLTEAWGLIGGNNALIASIVTFIAMVVLEGVCGRCAVAPHVTIHPDELEKLRAWIRYENTSEESVLQQGIRLDESRNKKGQPVTKSTLNDEDSEKISKLIDGLEKVREEVAKLKKKINSTKATTFNL